MEFIRRVKMNGISKSYRSSIKITKNVIYYWHRIKYIVIDVGNSYKFDLELHGLSLVCNSTNPITVISGDEVAIKAKKDTKNYISKPNNEL